MNGDGQSDGPVVPAILLNKAVAAVVAPAAEVGEERGSVKGNTGGETRAGRSAGSGVSSELGRVREVARRDRKARFTALLHHVSLDRLRAAYWAIRPQAAPGVDGVTWAQYGQDLQRNVQVRCAPRQPQSSKVNSSKPARLAQSADGRHRGREADQDNKDPDRRFRWSGSVKPGEELCGRGGVEPPTFHFSDQRSQVVAEALI